MIKKNSEETQINEEPSTQLSESVTSATQQLEVEEQIEIDEYGINKPTRYVIKGKSIRDEDDKT